MEGAIGLFVLAVLAIPVLLVVALVKLGDLRRRVEDLEATLADRRTPAAEADEPTLSELVREPLRSPAATPLPRPFPQPQPQPASSGASPRPESRETPLPAPPRTPPGPPQRAAPVEPVPRPRRPSAHGVADPVTVAVRAIRRWFGEGNVPVKVGMLVLFAGVAALLKYASDQGWLRLPIELRLVAVAVAASVALAFAWGQRHQRRHFALGLQGGALGVLLLVVFAAFKLYGLLPPAVAFALSVGLVAATCALAVAQNAFALALLGTLAGFLAPLWLSTGPGNHVVLFGYYALLNAGIFAIAWWRSWRALNVLGFVFTFGIGTWWGVLDYRPQDFETTQPFLLLFFTLYLLIPILYARRRAAGRRDVLDACLLFGTPLVAFSLQAGLLEGDPIPLAMCALALAVVYAGLAWVLRGREHYRLLVAPYGALAVGFGSLAVPLALSAQATAGVFALEGAALAWLGLRHRNRLQQWAGAGLQLAAAMAFSIAIEDMPRMQPPVANAWFMAALLVAVAGFASAWSYRRHGPDRAAGAYYLWALAWWLGNGWREIDRLDAGTSGIDFMALLMVATGWLASEVHRRLPSSGLAWTAVLAVVSMLPLAFVQDGMRPYLLAGHGWTVWLVFVLAGWRMLGSLRSDAGALAALAHGGWWLAWTLVASLSLYDVYVRFDLGSGWRFAVAFLPWLALASALQWRPHWVAPPFGRRFDTWHDALQRLLAGLLALGWLVGLQYAGDSAPMPWIPLLNPLDLVQALALVILAASTRPDDADDAVLRQRVPMLAGAAFALLSVIALRACHHWGDVAWDGSMFSTGLVQATLTVVWSLLGVFGWIVGSRRGHRTLWLAGALLMGVVLAKLLLADREHLGNLLGILSFIAYGVLCTVVGYFAPAPPRAAETEGRTEGPAQV